MLCLSGFELYPRWVPLSPHGARERAVPAGACCYFLTSLTSFRDSLARRDCSQAVSLYGRVGISSLVQIK